jgi:CheY-like chemotaxis protein
MSDRKTILLIEDNDADVLLIERALAKMDTPLDMSRFRDGAEVLPVLLKAEHGDLPDLILLDLRMPRSNGLDVLRQIRTTPKLCNIPVGILTSSDAPSDQHRAATLGATCYIRKASYLDLFILQVNDAVQAMLDGRPPMPSPGLVAVPPESHTSPSAN